MSFRDRDDRGYKVVYNNRPREPSSASASYSIDDRRPRQYYDDDYDDAKYPRGSRGALYGRSDRDRGYAPSPPPPPGIDSAAYRSSSAATTKTTYDVMRRGNVIVIDRSRDHGLPASDYEVIKPERAGSGAYVLEPGRGVGRSRGYMYDYEHDNDYGRSDRTGRDVEVLQPRRHVSAYDVGPPQNADRRDRSSKLDIAPMEAVQVIDDDSDSDYRRRSRRKSVVDNDPPSKRLRSAIRRGSVSPRRRRSRSVGFYKDQLSHHDASESRHERPGAEAVLAGRYLVGRTGDVNGGRDKDRTRGIGDGRTGARKGRYPPQRSEEDSRRDDEEEEGYDNGYGYGSRRNKERRRRDDYDDYDDDDNDGYEYERRGPYPPQRDLRREDRGDYDDDRSVYSQYDERKTKSTYR